MDPAHFPDRNAGPGPDLKGDSATDLREQAAACRRLASNARTRAGTKALDALGEHLDDRARKLDPNSMRR